MYVCMYVCFYVCMYLCMCTRLPILSYALDLLSVTAHAIPNYIEDSNWVLHNLELCMMH